jgi:hypothetical protein
MKFGSMILTLVFPVALSREEEDYYKILGVDRSATEDQLKKAYYKVGDLVFV